MIERKLKLLVFVPGIVLSFHCAPLDRDAAKSELTGHVDPVVEAAVTVKTKEIVAITNVHSQEFTVAGNSGKPSKAGKAAANVERQLGQDHTVLQSDHEYFASSYDLKPNGQDQSGEINRVLALIPQGGTFVFDTGPEFLINSPLRITRPITIVGKNAQLNYTGPGGVTILNLESSGITLKGIHIKAVEQAYQPKSFMIGNSWKANSSPLTDINITDCTLSGYSGVGINLRSVATFNLLNNQISHMPYAGIACYSVSEGLIEGNTIQHITALGATAGNAYGITIQQLGKEFVSRGIRISNNHVEDVPWEGIDTHGSENLYVYNNDLKSCAVGIAMVSSRIKSPQMVVIANNRIENQGHTESAIRFDGRGYAKNATGIIVNNDIRGQHIRLENTDNLLIFGNDVRESETGYGIFLSGQNQNTSILNNSIQDVWSKGNGNSYAIYFKNDSNTAIIDGNRMITKGFKPPNNSGNKFGFKINEKSQYCSANIGSNDFGTAKMKDYENTGDSKKFSRVQHKSSKNDYTGIEDRGVIMLNDMSAKAEVILPELTEQNNGLAFILTNASKKPVGCNVTLTSMKDPSSNSNSIPGSSTIVFLYDFYAKKIWMM
ncbi:MAG TPA: right-handed parallel beta-helix repeat-containing protein [Flavitalea sp.]|nr:right-handed parallel beta-helix repeat-containing protein [Flavitalea sp.]